MLSRDEPSHLYEQIKAIKLECSRPLSLLIDFLEQLFLHLAEVLREYETLLGHETQDRDQLAFGFESWKVCQGSDYMLEDLLIFDFHQSCAQLVSVLDDFQADFEQCFEHWSADRLPQGHKQLVSICMTLFSLH